MDLSVARDDLNSALGFVKDFVEGILADPQATGNVFASKPLDEACLRIGRRLLHESRRNNNRFQSAVSGEAVYIATELYMTGGHSAVLSDFISHQPAYRHRILLSDLFAVQDKTSIENRFAALGAAIEWAPNGDPAKKLHWLQNRLWELNPRRTFLFNHHQDAVAVAAAQRDLVGELFFYHHGDHSLCLGVHIPHSVHIDFRGFGFENCRNSLRVAHNVLVPITVDDSGARPQSMRFLVDGMLRTCSSGAAHKFENPYRYEYSAIVPKILAVTGGQHLHLGPLSADTLDTIRTELGKRNIDPGRFRNIHSVPSVWNALIDNGIDLYLSSFPHGGVRAAVEVMGSATPMAVHVNYSFPALSELDAVYPEAFNWRNPDELFQFLPRIDQDFLQEQSARARHHYETHCHPDLLTAELVNMREPRVEEMETSEYPPPADPLEIYLEKSKAQTSGNADPYSEIARLTRRSEALEQELARIRGSISWRVTRALRAMRWVANRIERLCRRFSVLDLKEENYPLFDPDYYVRCNPGLKDSRTNPLRHFLTRGAFESRDPHPLFSVAYYLKQNPQVAERGINPLCHYMEIGAGEGQNPHPLFDAKFYLREYGRQLGKETNPLLHYLETGISDGRNPHPLFNTGYYLERYPDVAAAGVNPLRHFVEVGGGEGRNPHPLFDARFYLAQNPGLAESSVNPLQHFIENGAGGESSPHPSFHSGFYLHDNPDVRLHGHNPLAHFIERGAAESRQTCPEKPIWSDPALAADLSGLLGGGWDKLYDSKDVAKDLAVVGESNPALEACWRAIGRDPLFTAAKELAARIGLALSRFDDVERVYRTEFEVAGCLRPHEAEVPRKHFVAARYLGVQSWCRKAGAPCMVVRESRNIQIEEPKFLDRPLGRHPSGIGRLPEGYLAEISNATVIGGTNLVLTDEGEALYDELALAEEGRYGLKTSSIKMAAGGNLLAKFTKSRNPVVLDRAIHLCQDHSANYFHWLVECLPRLQTLEKFPHLGGIPLLIDANLPKQQLEALDLVDTENHPIVHLERGQAVQVEKLYYPSDLSVIHDNYEYPVAFDKDILICPAALVFIREACLSKANPPLNDSPPRIFVSRGGAAIRRLENEGEIELMLQEFGFVTIRPEQLGFLDQVRIFSNAEFLVGPTGVGLANMLFTPSGCKVIILTSDNPQSNFYIYSQIGSNLNLDLRYFTGKDHGVSESPGLHSNYVISPGALRNALADFL